MYSRPSQCPRAKYSLFCFLYIQYIFRAEPVPKGSKQRTVHEELAKSLTLILRPANVDQLVVIKFLNNAWFFFQVIIKSMTQFLLDGERVKVGTCGYTLYPCKHSY